MSRMQVSLTAPAAAKLVSELAQARCRNRTDSSASFVDRTPTACAR